MELFKKNTSTAYTYTSSTPKDYDLLTLRFYTAFQLFTSHSLNVDTENLVLGFLFHSSRIQSARLSTCTLAYMIDVLSTTLRFSHISTSKLLSALRDNEHLRASKVFTARAQEEFLARAQLPRVGGMQIIGVSKIEQPRNAYDEEKAKSAQEGGRKRYLGVGVAGSILIEDLMEWLRYSKHAKKESEN
jgi:hypothetical protein